jgi:hypothetical protein
METPVQGREGVSAWAGTRNRHIPVPRIFTHPLGAGEKSMSYFRAGIGLGLIWGVLADVFLLFIVLPQPEVIPGMTKPAGVVPGDRPRRVRPYLGPVLCEPRDLPGAPCDGSRCSGERLFPGARAVSLLWDARRRDCLALRRDGEAGEEKEIGDTVHLKTWSRTP